MKFASARRDLGSDLVRSKERVPADLPDSDASAQVDELYRAHSSSLLRLLIRKTGCRDLARELMQEAFAKLLRMSPSKLAQIEQPEAYLRRISSNLLTDWGRSRTVKARVDNSLAEQADASFDQVTALESRDTLRRLELALAKLKPKSREIFLARRLHGLSYAEIASQTGLSIAGVEKQMAKAIAKIDRLLDRR